MEQQQHHARKLTYVEVNLEPWNHNNDGGIKENVIDYLDIMDAFDIVPISHDGTPLSRSLFATNHNMQQTMLGTNHIQPRMTTQNHVLPNNIQDGHHIDMRVQSVIRPQETNRPTKNYVPITSRRKSARIRKAPIWTNDYELF
jgi:hypothetical protein